MTDRQPTLVFAGDSITDAEHREDPDGLGQGYVRVLASALTAYEVVNAGTSGNRVIDLAERWETDVLSRSPRVTTVLIGVNDTWRRYDAGIRTSAAQFASTYEQLLKSVTASGSSLVLMTPFLIPVNGEQHRWKAEDLDAKIEVTHTLARKFDAVLVDLNGALTAAAALDGATAIAEDGVHPTPRGHELIAASWTKATCDLLSELS